MNSVYPLSTQPTSPGQQYQIKIHEQKLGITIIGEGNNPPIIRTIHLNEPAYNAGVTIGSEILKINNKDCKKYTHKKCYDLITKSDRPITLDLKHKKNISSTSFSTNPILHAYYSCPETPR